MESQNLNQPDNLQQQAPPPQTSATHKFRTLTIVLVIIFLLSALGFGAYFLGKRSTQPVHTSTNSVVETIPTPTPDPIANWKTYTGVGYSFNYPSDWSSETNDYLGNGVRIDNSRETVSITISEGQYPFGFGDPGTVVSSPKPIELTIDGKKYNASEYVINNKDAYVNLGPVSSRDHYILFGTGYPGGFSGKSSLSDYYSVKETIIQILSTLKFTD